MKSTCTRGVVEASSGTVFAPLEAPIAGQVGGAGSGGAAATGGAVNAGGTPSGTSHAEYGPDGETSEYLFRLDRGSAQGALTARFHVVLWVHGGCGEWDQPEMELRVDVAD